MKKENNVMFNLCIDILHNICSFINYKKSFKETACRNNSNQKLPEACHYPLEFSKS